jgi:hypothetical protein
MPKKFENKKLNKEDHAKVDKYASMARQAFEGAGVLGLCFITIKKVPWQKVGGTIGKIVFRG